jgi:SsrA-binding protein
LSLSERFQSSMPEAKTFEPKPKFKAIKPIADNRRARHEYLILDEIEVGIALAGTEVKSLRNGKVQLSDGYAHITDGEMWLENVHISPYVHGNRFNLEDKRKRKLLAHKREIDRLGVKLRDNGLTLVPLRIYFKGNKVKLLIGVARGKKAYDKRQAIKERDAKRDIRSGE